MRKQQIHKHSNERRRRTSARRATAAVTALLLVAPAAAAAQPTDAANLPDPPASSPGPAMTPAEVSQPDGFDWGDAAIGAGAVTGAMAVGLGCAVGARRLRDDSQRRGMAAAGSS
jgi:hypothetical protein